MEGYQSIDSDHSAALISEDKPTPTKSKPVPTHHLLNMLVTCNFHINLLMCG